jgi:hypothetical protein
MAVHLTAAQARALGVDAKAKARTTRRTARGAPYFTVCKACGFESRTQAAEDRHLAANPGHCRYELVLGL